ncbi:MAG: hypothetical protein K0B07_05760 [DPANN group archaeon]|nr:hypothetical protein [DPANN group archaeon]
MKKVNIYEYRDNFRLMQDRQKYIDKITLLELKRDLTDVIDDNRNLTNEIQDIDINIRDSFLRVIKIDDVLLNRLYKNE